MSELGLVLYGTTVYWVGQFTSQKWRKLYGYRLFFPIVPLNKLQSWFERGVFASSVEIFFLRDRGEDFL